MTELLLRKLALPRPLFADSSPWNQKVTEPFENSETRAYDVFDILREASLFALAPQNITQISIEDGVDLVTECQKTCGESLKDACC